MCVQAPLLLSSLGATSLALTIWSLQNFIFFRSQFIEFKLRNKRLVISILQNLSVLVGASRPRNRSRFLRLGLEFLQDLVTLQSSLSVPMVAILLCSKIIQSHLVVLSALLDLLSNVISLICAIVFLGVLGCFRGVASALRLSSHKYN